MPPADLGRVVLGALGIALFAAFCGVGGPPSLLRQDLPLWLKSAALVLLPLYMASFLIAVVGVVVAAAVPSTGRLIACVAAFLTSLGNVVSSIIGAEGESRGAFVVSMLFLPFVLVMWSHSRNRGPHAPSTGRTAAEQADAADEVRVG
jgi:hypothetical protein